VRERDGRLSYADLAEQIDLSKAAAPGGVRRLEQEKGVTGYRAQIEPALTIKSHLHAQFEQAVVRHPAVLECYTTPARPIVFCTPHR
jgi:Lrp/AsnC family leucine-responsive transcriptional regulator